MTPSSESSRTESVLACEECDLVHVDVPLSPGTSARCRRCGARLARNTGGHLERPLTLSLAALAMFAVANANEILQLEVSGQTSSTTLLGAVERLQNQGMWLVALLVLMTTFVCPLLQLGAMSYLLVPLRRGIIPPGFAALMRLIGTVQPWGMLEVFVLGSLVSFAKLARIAIAVPGIGLWSYGALILLTAGAAMTFDGEDLWRRAEAISRLSGRGALKAGS